MFTGGYSTICSVVLFLLGILNTCNSLSCHSCNVTASAKYSDDPCKGISSIVKCQDPALCLSVTYSIQDINSKHYQYTTVKSCYLKMGGNECDNYLKNIRNLFPASTKIEYKEKCFTCETENCNDKSSSNKVLPTIVVSLLCYLLGNLI